jgi:Short C-terminal domain
VDELAKLADLHKQGALTDQEFENAKAKLLGQM